MKQIITTIVGMLTMPICIAANPASTSYVDHQIALAKAALISHIENNPSIAHPVESC